MSWSAILDVLRLFSQIAQGVEPIIVLIIIFDRFFNRIHQSGVNERLTKCIEKLTKISNDLTPKG